MSTKRNYCNGTDLQEKILKGVNVLADSIASTLGPRGRNVALQQINGMPFITKDGVTISKFVAFKDHFENLGAQVVKQAAAKTNEDAGDGTTTSTVLARAVYRESQKYLRSGISPIELKRGMDSAKDLIINNLQENSKPIRSREDVQHVATISANGEVSIGKLIATAFDTVGKDGSITIEEARSTETSLDLIEGFTFDSGYASPQFITDERRGVINYEDCLIMVTDLKLSSVEEMLPILELTARESRPFVIVADDIEGQLLAALVINSMRGSMKVVAVKAPRYGEERQNTLADLALSTGARLIKREAGIALADVKLEHFGKAKSIEILKNSTTIVGGNADHEKIEQKIEFLKEQIKQEDSLATCEKIQERITRLASGVAVIRVGAATQVEMIEKKHRIEDALEAVKAAQAGGIHLGGGVPLIKASFKIKPPKELTEEQKIGFNIVLKAIQEPARQMAENAGMSADLIVSKIKKLKGNKGVDFSSENTKDFFEEGIIDPVRVTCCALNNAISVASTLITTNYAIVESE